MSVEHVRIKKLENSGCSCFFVSRLKFYFYDDSLLFLLRFCLFACVHVRKCAWAHIATCSLLSCHRPPSCLRSTSLVLLLHGEFPSSLSLSWKFRHFRVVNSWFWWHVFVSSQHVGPTRPTCRQHHVMSGSFFLCRMSFRYLIADMSYHT
jgi:hypothetical protein